jgi:VWFA-related protein
MLRLTTIFIVLCVAAAPVARGEGPVPATLSTDTDTSADAGSVREDVLVRRVVWPVYVREKNGGHGECDLLGPGDIRLEEDGRSVEITHVEAPGWHRSNGASSVPIVHALLIDSSVSMRTNDRLRHAKAAAQRYVDQLPAGEEVLVASFDDSMVLVSPATTDRARTRADIDRVEIGNWTALWDAVYELIGYLETLPGQKVVVLLSDGHDHTSLTRLASKSIIDLAAETADITLFTVGVDLVRHGRIERNTVRSFLQELASATGGRYFETRGIGVFNEVFDRIREHMSRRFYLVYVPFPFGEGPRDEPLLADYRHRVVRVKANRGVPCKVTTAGPPTRIEGRRDAGVARAVGSESQAPDTLASLLPCGYVSDSARVSHQLRLPPPDGWPLSRRDTPSLFVLDPPAGVIPARAPDILLDRGVLYRDRPYRKAGQFRASFDRDPEIEMRDFAVEVPAFGEVRRDLHTPEDVMLRMLEREYCAPVGTNGRSLLLVHGKTFLEMRRLIGLALFENYPEYREWATNRLVEEAKPDVERVLAALEAERTLTPEQEHGIRASMIERAENPGSETPQRFLAEWLGDVSARDLALALETRLSNTILGGGGGHRELAVRIADVGWDPMLEWFPPATEVRILSPLVPAYDPERDAIGFYRVILPRPNFDGPPEDPVPERPLALRTVRWLLENDDVATALDGVEVDSVDQVTLSRGQRQALNRRLRRAGHDDQTMDVKSSLSRAGVMLDFPGVPGVLEVSAYFGESGDVPRCVTTCFAGEISPALADLADSISGVDGYAGLPCERR